LARYDANGTLDGGFGTGGKVTTPFTGSSNDTGQCLVVQTDGKIIVAGSSAVVVAPFSLARHNSTGSLDPTFGTTGTGAPTPATRDSSRARLCLQPDGKIVVAGPSFPAATGFAFSLARYNADGSLDTTFGTGGKVTTDFAGGNDLATGVVLQSDGRIVVAGS